MFLIVDGVELRLWKAQFNLEKITSRRFQNQLLKFLSSGLEIWILRNTVLVSAIKEDIGTAVQSFVDAGIDLNTRFEDG